MTANGSADYGVEVVQRGYILVCLARKPPPSHLDTCRLIRLLEDSCYSMVYDVYTMYYQEFNSRFVTPMHSDEPLRCGMRDTTTEKNPWRYFQPMNYLYRNTNLRRLCMFQGALRLH